MSRLFRSAIVPLVIIAALVWFLGEALLPSHDQRKHIAYSELITAVKSHPEDVQKVQFDPKTRSI